MPFTTQVGGILGGETRRVYYGDSTPAAIKAGELLVVDVTATWKWPEEMTNRPAGRTDIEVLALEDQLGSKFITPSNTGLNSIDYAPVVVKNSYDTAANRWIDVYVPRGGSQRIIPVLVKEGEDVDVGEVIGAEDAGRAGVVLLNGQTAGAIGIAVKDSGGAIAAGGMLLPVLTLPTVGAV